jgi:lysophospholipase L1-like esterase
MKQSSFSNGKREWVEKGQAAAPSQLRRAIRLVGRIAAATLIVFVALILFGLGIVYYEGKRPPTGNNQYVALGASFSAGPGVGERAPNSPTLCIRSAQNYPNLLAQARHLNLTDVSCSGATTQHVLYGGQAFQPPQLDALRSSTELVTVAIGGNDVAYVTNIYSWACQQASPRWSFPVRSLLCNVPATPDAEVDRALERLPDQLKEIANQVKQRSPHATLVFLDAYAAVLLPEEGACPQRLPITEEQLRRSLYVTKALSDITASVARDAGAILVHVPRGHDICSDDPWVFGFDEMPAWLFNFEPMAYHPTGDAMQAIAEAINEALPPLP